MKKPRILTGPFYGERKAQVNIAAMLPEMFRGVQFDRAQVNETERTIPVVYATEKPAARWFGRERLICAPGAVRLERLNQLGAFLSEHNRERQIGVAVKDSLTFAQGGEGQGRALANLRFSKSNPLAEQEFQDVKDGIRGLFSVGYIVHRLLLVEEDEEGTQGGDLYNAVDWEPLEISLVSVPADYDCVIEENSANKSLTFPVSVTTEKDSQAESSKLMNRRSFYFSRFLLAPDDGGNNVAGGNGGGAGAQNPPANNGGGNPNPPQNRGEGNGGNGGGNTVEQERTRCRELSSLGTRFNCAPDMATMIENGSTVEQAYRWLAENRIASQQGGGNGGNGGANGGAPGNRAAGATNPANPGGGNRPLLTEGAGNEGQQPLSRSIGSMLVESEQFRSLVAMGRSSKSAGFEFPLTSFRAVLTTAGVSGSTFATDRVPGIVELNQQRLTVADLCAPGMTGGNKIEYLQETAYANAAATVAEGAAKPEATFTLAPADAPVRKIAVTAKITDEMLADYPFVRSFVDARMQFMVEEREEAQLLFGDGTNPNILGFMNVVGTQAQAMGDDSAVDAIHKAITKCRVVAKVEPTGVIIHPNDWEKIRLSKDANGQYLAGGPFYAPYGAGGFVQVDRIWGLPVVVTTAITEGTALVGAFRTQSQIFRRQGITVETTNANEDDFKNNLIAIRAEERLALCVYRPPAFVKVTGINA